ncbi:MAG: hypothetical protein RRY65_00115 [Pseudoflavonifractor sp.]
MKDRQALNPGWVKLTFEDGSVKRAKLTRDDNPVVDGDPMTKVTLLKDATCRMLGGDPATMVPDDAIQMLAALASGGGGSGDAGLLEDTDMEVGTLTNAGAGWNTYHFREAFEGIPQVVAGAEDFAGVVQIKSITADGFLYCLRLITADGTTTTASAVAVNYIAIEYGGER